MRTPAESAEAFAAAALTGLLASPQPVIQNLDFKRLVNLAAEYGEALAARVENPPAKA
jgi:hypothetical protein